MRRRKVLTGGGAIVLGTLAALIPTVHEGMVLFEASGTDWSVEDIKIMLNRNDVRATWETTP